MKWQNMKYLTPNEETWNKVQDMLLKNNYSWIIGGTISYFNQFQIISYNSGRMSLCLSLCNNSNCSNFHTCEAKNLTKTSDGLLN